MSTVEIALDPTLNAPPHEFVAAWNGSPECRAKAEAELGDAKTATYDPTRAAFAGAVLTGVATGVTTNALTELIQRALARRGATQPTEVVEVSQPGGARLLVVRVAQGSS